MKKIGLLVETSTTWGRKICAGVQQYATKKGDWMVFIEPRGMEEQIATPRGWRGDGIIARISSPELGHKLQKLKTPIVNVSSIELTGKPFPRVCTDLPALGRLAFRYFKDRGFRNYAYFSLIGLKYIRPLEKAFSEEIKKSGFTCSAYSTRPKQGSEPRWDLDLEALGLWLRSLPKPVAILSWNAGCSRELLFASQHAGLLVPEEVSILSSAEDDLLCATAHIPISGVEVPLEKIGYKAAELLDQLIQKKDLENSNLLFQPTGIVSRRSTDTLAITDPHIVKSIQYIRQNLSQSLSVNDIAQHAGTSRRVLERKFQAILGRSPALEIRRARMEKARSLLISTTLSTDEISELTGLCTPQYFSHLFKKTHGISPLKYRQKFRFSQ